MMLGHSQVLALHTPGHIGKISGHVIQRLVRRAQLFHFALGVWGKTDRHPANLARGFSVGNGLLVLFVARK